MLTFSRRCLRPQGMGRVMIKRRAFRTHSETQRLATKFLLDAQRIWPGDRAILRLTDMLSEDQKAW